MKILLGIAVSILCAVPAAAQDTKAKPPPASNALCDVELKTTTTFSGGVPLGDGIVHYYGLDATAIATMEKGLDRITKIGQNGGNKGGSITSKLEYTKTCDGTPTTAPPLNISGMSLKATTSMLRSQYKEGEAVLKQFDDREEKGKGKENPWKN